MRIASIEGRACIVSDSGGVDISQASSGQFSSSSDELLDRLETLKSWYDATSPKLDPALEIGALQNDLIRVRSPVATPSQIFAVGLNYQAHGEEAGLKVPDEPMIFTKFPSSITGPGDMIELPNGNVDWEVEMVAVIGKPGRNISASDALSHIAGFCVGQDISNRALQFKSTPAQFSFAKSHKGFSPIGPWLTTTDEMQFSNARILCRNQGEVLQDGNTSRMIFSVPELIEYLSRVCELRTGDLIFTGTPDGVGIGRSPHKFIEPGWVLESTIEGLGTMRNACVLQQ